MNLLNQQAGATYDFGAGDDTLHLVSNGPFVNVVSVRNIEHVDSVGFGSDQIHILGNSGGVTTVTAGGGADLVWASGDADHFRFTLTGDSFYDIPNGGLRDVIFDFDASQDAFVFDGIAHSNFTYQLVSSGGAEILRLDFDGNADPDGDNGWDMAIQLTNLQHELTAANFVFV